MSLDQVQTDPDVSVNMTLSIMAIICYIYSKYGFGFHVGRCRRRLWDSNCESELSCSALLTFSWVVFPAVASLPIAVFKDGFDRRLDVLILLCLSQNTSSLSLFFFCINYTNVL